jgi:hypothetical protein
LSAFAYFPLSYRSDLLVFAEKDVPAHGPFGCLCGMTLGRVLEPSRPERYANAEDFLCTLYYLNLFHQGIHEYFSADHTNWLAHTESFPDIRACTYHHGGVSKPGDIIRFARSPQYIPGAQSLRLPDQLLHEYATFFLREFVPGLCGRLQFRTLSANALREHLIHDRDCSEFSLYAGGNAA